MASQKNIIIRIETAEGLLDIFANQVTNSYFDSNLDMAVIQFTGGGELNLTMTIDYYNQLIESLGKIIILHEHDNTDNQ